MISKKFTLNKQEQEQWATNTLTFLAPLGIIYFGYVVAQVTDPSSFTLEKLIPNQIVTGSLVLYVANSLFDICRKYMAGRSK
jgi:hypothetical protein